MAKMKTTTNAQASSSFLPYDGPAIAEGSYTAVFKNPRLKLGKDSGNYYINFMGEISEPKTSDASKYNGAAVWGMCHFQAEHEAMQARYNSFLAAFGIKTKDPEIVYESQEDADSGKGSKITSIGGVKLDGRKVRIIVRKKAASQGYAESMDIDLISLFTGESEAAEDINVEVDDEDQVEGEEIAEDEDDTEEREARTAELKKEPLADLRAAAKEAEIDIKGLKKAEIVDAIVEWEFTPVDEDEADEDEESEEAEELEEAEEEDEADEDEDEEAEEEEEEDEEDAEATLREELSELDRAALKKRLKGLDAEKKVFTKTTEEDLINWIVDLELNTPPF